MNDNENTGITDEMKLRAFSLFISTLLYKNDSRGFEKLTKKADVIYKYICNKDVDGNDCNFMDDSPGNIHFDHISRR